MDKPITMLKNEFRQSIIKTINETTLPIWIVEMIIKDIYSEIFKATNDFESFERAKYEKDLEESKLKSSDSEN